MTSFRYLEQLPDWDEIETEEWIESVEGLVQGRGSERARRVLLHALARADELGVRLPRVAATDYLNSIAAIDEPPYPGDERYGIDSDALDPAIA